uniref:Putative secreted protein n=1 Tax=Ixodes ricinus TaxID=34613 RepID=A0A0K8R4C0_IXORI
MHNGSNAKHFTRQMPDTWLHKLPFRKQEQTCFRNNTQALEFYLVQLLFYSRTFTSDLVTKEIIRKTTSETRHAKTRSRNFEVSLQARACVAIKTTAMYDQARPF